MAGFGSVSSNTGVNVDGSGNLSLVAGGNPVWTAATNGVSYASHESIANTNDGVSACATQQIANGEVWVALVRVWRATDSANQRFYEVRVANLFYAPGFAVTPTDLGGGPTASATFSVSQVGSNCATGDSAGTAAIVLQITGSTGGNGQWAADIYWRKLYA
ncbi:MAG TPA: hypothetical protein VFM96_01470 [Gaiellaceae bacterium]|nr:hypothetical protein [Gaiellaceae bacterium]